jgi:hypothetical protein
VIAELIAAVREQSLCPRPTVLHRQVTQIWNEAARDPALGLRPVTVPPYRSPKRIDPARLHDAFRQDVEEHLSWCGVSDPFAADARPRALAPGSLRLRRDQIHAAVTALVESGIKPSAIRSLADLVSCVGASIASLYSPPIPENSKPSNSFLGIGASRPRSGHMQASMIVDAIVT